MIELNTIKQTAQGFRDDMTAFLDRLIRFESLSGHEGPAMEWVYNEFMDIADVCEKVPIPESIVDDPEFCDTYRGEAYEGRPNIRVVLKGDGSGKSVLFNTHVDVVPGTDRQERPFDPFVRDGAMYGRGSCDAKGQVAVLWTMLKTMKKLGIRPKGDIILHIVVDEETGGNGTLAMIREGDSADCCVNLEPCSNHICPSIRGSVWYTATCYGRAGHAGSAEVTVSALDMAVEAMRIIKEYHDELLKNTIDDDPLFSVFKNPMPVCIGELHAGNWPTIAPEKAEFKGMFGFLTTPREEVMHEIEHRVRTRGPEWLKDNFDIVFPYRHDAARLDPSHPIVTTMAGAFRDCGLSDELKGVTTSMDGWMYSRLSGIPTVATGCGSLSDAHTINEHVVLDEVIDCAVGLVEFIRRFSGNDES